MITTKQELRNAINADRARYHLRKPFFLGWFFGDENYNALRFLNVLRHLEYYTNRPKNLLTIVPWIYYFLRHRRMRIKYGLYISVNTIEPGIYIPHYRGGVYANCQHMGHNCIISSGCVLGTKTGRKGGPIVGNNVEIAIGAKVIGPIKIGNNVIIAPNSVVIKDVPDDCIVSGIPAQIIKMNRTV